MARFQTQRDQIEGETLNALDNSALYAETRGDRGGIGQAQYNTIQATAAQNRQAVNLAQSQPHRRDGPAGRPAPGSGRI